MLTHGSSQVCEVYLKRDASMPDIWQPTVFMRSNMAEFLDTSCLYAIRQLKFCHTVWLYAIKHSWIHWNWFFKCGYKSSMTFCAKFVSFCLFVCFFFNLSALRQCQQWSTAGKLFEEKKEKKKGTAIILQNHTYLITGERCTGITSSSSRLSVFYPTVIYTRNRCRVWKNA